MTTRFPFHRSGSALLLAACLSLPAAPLAQSRPTPLTAQDYAEIQQLIARYAFALDTCADNGYEYARLYSRDGTYIRTNGNRYTGHDKLAEVAGGGPRNCRDASGPGHTTAAVKHIAVNMVIEATAEGARGRSYLVEIGGNAAASQTQFTGWYDDTYVKTPDGWRFKTRQHILGDQAAPWTTKK